MLNFVELFQKNKPKAIVHCGAQFFHIRNFYISQNLFDTIWIENQEFFYEYGKNLISESERIFNYTITQNNSLSNLFYTNNLNLSNYDYIHISLSFHINQGINIFSNEIENFKYVCIEVTNELGELNSDINKIKKWFSEKRYKLVESRSIDRLSYLYFTKKRQYNKK